MKSDLRGLLQKRAIVQIVTGIEVNGEVYFPRLREYRLSAEGNKFHLLPTLGNK